MGNSENSEKLGEFELIARFFSPLAKGYTGAFNLLDDCAAYTPEPGYDLVITKDTIVSGVHFFDDNPPSSIAIKALAVNLSDIAAKGAEPKVYLLSIALPAIRNAEWLQDFAKGLSRLQSEHNIHLIGGDTVSTNGPLTITITLIGQVPTGKMVLRSSARPGDRIYVTGTIGDSWLGLQTFLNTGNTLNLSPRELKQIQERYLHPRPVCKLATVIRNYATASMDISDGLITDLNKLCKASGAGSQVYTGKVPLSPIAQKYLRQDSTAIEKLITGGDDYELLITVPAERSGQFERAAAKKKVTVTNIGEIKDAKGVDILDESGKKMTIAKNGYDHFN